MHPATFIGGSSGVWRVTRISTLAGQPLAAASHLDVHQAHRPISNTSSTPPGWSLRGVAGHARYVERREKGPLDAASPSLGRPEATCAALIPIRKTAQWWQLPHDERRAIFETESQHISDTLQYLPRIARRLYHSRDLGEPFDFLTWFEFAPVHTAAFDELVAMLRSRKEWEFVDREVDIRLVRG